MRRNFEGCQKTNSSQEFIEPAGQKVLTSRNWARPWFYVYMHTHSDIGNTITKYLRPSAKLQLPQLDQDIIAKSYSSYFLCFIF